MRCFLVLALAAVAASASFAPLHIPAENGVPGRYIVVLEDEVNLDSFISSFNRKIGIETAIKTRFRAVLNGFVIKADLDGVALRQLRSLPGVKYVEEDEIVSIAGKNSATGSWGIDRIDSRSNTQDGIMDLEAYGSGTHIYVIDTGINPYHEDFGGRASVAVDIVGGQDGIDCHGHGTHCAGTAASNTYGVANEAQVYGIRSLDCNGSGYKSDSIAGLDWIADQGQRPAVASLSLGGSYSTAQNDAVAACSAAGVVVVVAAGNSNANACNYSPSSAPEAITVGSTTSSDGRSYFSNWGNCLDVFAPGSDIRSLSHSSNTGTTTMSGTSMACPHVSGIAAVLMSSGLSGPEAAARIVSDATDGIIPNPGLNSPNKMAYTA